jgi:hypothetical protein
MENNQNSFVKVDDHLIVNEKYIRWIKKINDCLEICTKMDGCIAGGNTHKICKLNNIDSYNKVNKLFE